MRMAKRRLLRITTVPQSIHLLLKGQLNFMTLQGFDVLAVSAPGREVELIRKTGIAHKSVAFTRKITPLRDLIALLSLIVIMIRFRPDIVHTHTSKAGLLGMAAAWICGVKVRLHTVAGLPLMETTGLKRWLLTCLELTTFRLAHEVYPNSHQLSDFIKNELKSRAHLKVLAKGSSNGIDADFYHATPALREEAAAIRKDHGIPDQAIVLSFVGRLVRDKGIVELAAMLKELEARSKSKPWLILVGRFEQDLNPIPADVLNYLQTSPNIIIAGFKDDTRPWLMASDIFVFPSYREGFPNVVMQAACLQLPCVVTDINGCNEIVRHHITGAIVPCKNVEALVSEVIALAEDTALRKQYGSQARASVARDFDQKFVWQAILLEYTRLLKDR